MLFDPLKKVSPIFGQSSLFPGARYQQGEYIYDAHRRCLNPCKEVQDPKQLAMKEAKKQLKAESVAKADAALTKLQTAKQKFEECDPSAAALKGRLKTAFNKAVNAYEKAQATLSTIPE